VFCARDESIDHLFFACPIARMIWSVFQCSYNTHAQPIKMAEGFRSIENKKFPTKTNKNKPRSDLRDAKQ
jgi:hypothetical protein